MRRSIFVLLCIVSLAVAVCPRPAAAIVLSGGPAGGGATANWDGVGILSNQYQPNGAGTATLIDPTHVLTVAHIIYGTSTASLAFHLNGNTYTAASVAIPSQYTGAGAVSTADAYDIAVVTLTTPVTGATTWGYNDGSMTATQRMAANATLVGYGYGGTGTGGADPTNYPFGTKREGINAIDLITSSNTSVSDALGHDNVVIPAGLEVWDFDDSANLSSNGPLGAAALGANEADSTDGDSGGPIFQFNSTLGRYVITGLINDGTDPNSRIGDIGWATDTAAYASFIASSVPEPMTLAPMLLVGLLLNRRRRRKPV